MANAQTKDPDAKKSLTGRAIGFAWERAKATPMEMVHAVGGHVEHAAADIGSTFQACLWAGWSTQSASIDAPDYISEQLAKDRENEKLEKEKETPTVGLEKA